MNQHYNSDQDSAASTVFDSDRDQIRRRSDRLQGIPPAQQTHQPHQATVANNQQPSPSQQYPTTTITPAMRENSSRHSERSIEGLPGNNLVQLQAQVPMPPQPQAEALGPYPTAQPPQPPIQEVQLHQQHQLREARRVPRQIFPARSSVGEHQSVHTLPPPLPPAYAQGPPDHSFQGYDATAYNNLNFIDDRSYPDQGTTSLPVPLHGFQPYEHISRDAALFNSRISNLSATVDSLVQHSNQSNEFHTRVDQQLARIDETNNRISHQMNSNQDEFRRFVREDLGSIIGSQISNILQQQYHLTVVITVLYHSLLSVDIVLLSLPFISVEECYFHTVLKVWRQQ